MLELANELFQDILYTLYYAIFPYFFPLQAEFPPEPDPPHKSISERLLNEKDGLLRRHQAITRTGWRIYWDWYVPIFRPVLWWRITTGWKELLAEIDWIDIDLDQ